MNKLWSKIAPVISPGIRTKLTVFTLIFVSALLASSFLFSYLRQKEDLSRAYDREIRAPLDLVSANVGELHKIAEAMIQLETFRIRLRQKTAEARRFRGVKTEKDNVFKWLGRKTGIRKQHYESYDTYYSTYLTDKNLKEFENLLKSFIDVTMNASVSTAEFTRWKALAAQAAPAQTPDPNSPEQSPSVLTSDTLTYDTEHETVTASGGVASARVVAIDA